jgi:hypothetical protein
LTKLLATHAPHILFVIAGVGAFFWAAYRKPPGGAARSGAEAPATPAVPRTRPRAPLAVARRALLALGPLLAALGTGAVLYGMDVGGASLPGALVWGHVGVSVLALLLVGYKLASMRGKRIFRGLALRRLPELLSLVLGVLFVPLVISGVDLLVAPSGGSFAAYSHLVSGAWWSGLLLWHLRRYVGASLRAVAGRPVAAPAPAGPAPAGAAGRAPLPQE